MIAVVDDDDDDDDDDVNLKFYIFFVFRCLHDKEIGR